MSSSSSLVDAYSVNAKVWFPDKEQGWISGHVTSRTIEGDQVEFGFVDDKGKVSPPLKRDGFHSLRGKGGGNERRLATRNGAGLDVGMREQSYSAG